MNENKWHTKTSMEIIEEFHSSERGLDKNEAMRRLKEYGLNKLPEAKAESFFNIFLRQFKSPLIYVLFTASFIVFLLGQMSDSFVIFFVLLINAVIGAIQEGKAQNTLLALKKFVETNATVLRDGQESITLDQELAPGDIIILQEGEKVPADARIIFSNGLKVDESALTGESVPVDKIEEKIEKLKVSPSEQKNMIFKGTLIVSGSGEAIVVATGINTVIGSITKEIAVIDTEIPLKANIRYLAKYIIWATVLFSIFLFASGIFLFNKSYFEMFMLVVALAVSFIPEGLPVAITLILAGGMWRMAKQNVLVKRLQAVEALGQAKIIAVDKTGTVTKNELVIRKTYINGRFYEIKGSGYEPRGDIEYEGNIIDPLNHQDLILAGKIAAFCANAKTVYLKEENRWRVAGDPTEAAMLVFAEKIGFRKEDLERELPKMAEIPFDYKTKYHATAHNVEGKSFLTVVGAPEIVLNFSSKIWKDGKYYELEAKGKKDLEAIFIKMSQEGLRVLAFAINPYSLEILKTDNIKNLSFVGFFGIRDTLRDEVFEAMRKSKEAGVRVVMITGDYEVTAKAIGKEAGIFEEGDKVLNGEDLDKMNENDLAAEIGKASIFARVTPEHKLKIIQAFRSRGEVVAMTGDGVNDALSLVAADLGVGMGKIGTEVAKESSDIILLDDNFGSIVSAIEEGKNIYRTIRKVLQYLFSTNLGEVLTITVALFAGYPLPLMASQIIWLNFVTDGFMVAALAMEPKEEGLLKIKLKSTKALVDKALVSHSFFIALVIAAGSLYIFKEYLPYGLSKAQTIVLTTMAVFQWFRAIGARSEDKSIFRFNPLSNKFLIGGIAVVILLQFAAVYLPFMQKILHTVPLEFKDWVAIMSVAVFVIIAEEIRKLIKIKRPV